MSESGVSEEEFGLEMCLVYVKVGRDLELRLTTYSDLVMTNLATLLLLLLLVWLLLTVIYSWLAATVLFILRGIYSIYY